MMTVEKSEYVLCQNLISDGVICPHDLFWTLCYIIKYNVLDIAFFYDKNDGLKKDIAVALKGCVNPYLEGVYIKTINGVPFRMGWANKPDYSKCYCESCKLALEHKFSARWKKSSRFLDKINWIFRKK